MWYSTLYICKEKSWGGQDTSNSLILRYCVRLAKKQKLSKALVVIGNGGIVHHYHRPRNQNPFELSIDSRSNLLLSVTPISREHRRPIDSRQTIYVYIKADKSQDIFQCKLASYSKNQGLGMKNFQIDLKRKCKDEIEWRKLSDSRVAGGEVGFCKDFTHWFISSYTVMPFSHNQKVGPRLRQTMSSFLPSLSHVINSASET